MIVLFVATRGVKRYYGRVSAEVSADENAEPTTLPGRVHAIVLIPRLHKPALKALALARATRPDALTAITLALDDDDTRYPLTRPLTSNVADHALARLSGLGQNKAPGPQRRGFSVEPDRAGDDVPDQQGQFQAGQKPS